MAAPLRFDSKVAIVTGGGSDTGRQCAIALARRGASVLVNDTATAYAGRPEVTYVADLVVEEIKAAGGTAVANHDSVQYSDRIVRTALDSFGRIDIIVNCAMVTRDQAFMKILPTDWALMARVNLRGTFQLMKAAWPHMKKQKEGRVVNVGNILGLVGARNMSMIAAAKLGLHGFTKALSTEGARFNIHINTIAPLKPLSRTPTADSAFFPASKVSPLVLWLCHHTCRCNGDLFEVGGGVVAKVRVQRTAGCRFPHDFEAEEVARKWKEIVDFSGETDSPGDVSQATQKLQSKL